MTKNKKNYTFIGMCKNCWEELKIKIPFGTTVKAHASNNAIVCDNCGCVPFFVA